MKKFGFNRALSGTARYGRTDGWRMGFFTFGLLPLLLVWRRAGIGSSSGTGIQTRFFFFSVYNLSLFVHRSLSHLFLCFSFGVPNLSS